MGRRGRLLFIYSVISIFAGTVAPITFIVENLAQLHRSHL